MRKKILQSSSQPQIKLNLLLSLMTICFCNISAANVSEFITAVGSSGGDAVWKIVSKSTATETDLEPGIYTRGAAHNWEHLLLPGAILGRENSSGFNQLDLTQNTNRLEAWAIIDGKIKFFHINTKDSDKDSYIVMGEGEHQLFDALQPYSGAINIPLITSLDDINVYTREVSSSPVSQELIISIRNQYSPFANQDGLTFSVTLSDKYKDSNKLSLAIKPQLIDYNFHESREKLLALCTQNGIFSKNHYDRIVKENKEDPLPVQVWKNQKKLEFKEFNFAKLPALDTQTGELIIPEKLKLTCPKLAGNQAISLEVMYSLDGTPPMLDIRNYGADKQVVGSLNFLKEAYEEIDSMDSLRTLAYYSMFKSKDRSFAVAYLDNELKIIYHIGDSYYISFLTPNDLPLNGEVPDDFSFEVVKVKKDQFHFYISAIKGEKKETYIYELIDYQGSLTVSSHIKIEDKFFTENEIKERIYNDGEQNYFDILSPSKDENKDSNYRYDYNETGRHIDVDLSLEKGTATLGFRRPLKSVQVSPKIFFNTYDSDRTSEKYDGLYKSESGNYFKERLKGTLLDSQNSGIFVDDADVNRGSTVILARKTIAHHIGNIDFTVVAMDEEFENGKNNFTLAFIANTTGAHLQTEITKIKIPSSFSDFKGIHFHGGNEVKPKESYLGAVILLQEQEKTTKTYYLVDFLIKELDSSSKEVSSFTFEIKKSNAIEDVDNIINENLETLAKHTLSDIIQRDDSGSILSYNYGEVLTPANLYPVQVSLSNTTEANDLYSDRITWDHPDHGPLEVDVFAIDPMFMHGSLGYFLILKANIKNGERSEYFIKQFTCSIDSLQGMSLVGPKEFSENRNKFGLVYALETETGDTKGNKSGFHSLFFTVSSSDKPKKNSKKNNSIFSSPVRVTLESIDLPNFEEFDYKIKYDATGQAYWSTSDYIDSHRMYKVKSLSTGEDFYPNQINLHLESGKNIHSLGKKTNQEGEWRVKKGNYLKPNLPGVFGKIEKEDKEDYKNIVFDDLLDLLDDMGNPETSAKHSALLVSKEVKKYVMNAISAKWLMSDNGGTHWSHLNRSLALSFLNKDKTIDQASIFRNFTSMSQSLAKHEKPVLLVDISDILGVDPLNPSTIDVPYTISIPKENKLSSSNLTKIDDLNELNGGINEANNKITVASILYILSSEGRAIPLKDYAKKGEPEISIMLVGTHSEWSQIKEKTSIFERQQGLIDNFAELGLETPSSEQRRNLLMKVIDEKSYLFQDIEFSGEKICIDYESLDEEELKNKVVDYAVSRSEALAREKNENTFVSFVKLLNKFKSSIHPGLAGDSGASLLINKSFIENIMCDLYGLPLNLHSLPANDPLKILADNNAVMRLSDEGYRGSFEIKKKIIKGILGQTNSGDQKTIPASFVIYGQKGSGKTFLFKTLVKMLGLKYYDFKADIETNQEAQVFFINLGSVVSGFTRTADDSETITTTKLLEDFDKFLKLPNGKRGFIIFDDAHLSSSEVRGEVFSKIRSLFEAKDGRYQGVNVRNLSLFMTFNPTQEIDKIKKFVSKGEPTPLQLTLATFQGEHNIIDESFFNRWGEIINLDIFSSSAKGNELVNKLSSTQKSFFAIDNTFFTVPTDTIDKIVSRFPKLNARDFLSSGIKSLTGVLQQDRSEENLSLIVPKNKMPYSGNWSSSSFPSRSTESTGKELEDFIQENFRTISISNDIRGFLYFLDMITNNFRINLYRDLVESINNNREISSSPLLQKFKLSPVLNAVKAHLKEHPKLSLLEYSLDQDLIRRKLALLQTDRIGEYTESIYVGVKEKGFFPEVFARSYKSDRIADYLLGDVQMSEQQPTRLEFLHTLPRSQKHSLETYLLRFLFIKNKMELNSANIENWAAHLPSEDPANLSSQTDNLSHNLSNFLTDFYSNTALVENMDIENYSSASNYDIARLYLYTLDKAITLLEWDSIAIFIINALKTLTSDMSLSTKPGAQQWLFDSNRSVLRPMSMESIFEHIKNTLLNNGGEWSEAQTSEASRGFQEKIGSLFFEGHADKNERGEK